MPHLSPARFLLAGLAIVAIMSLWRPGAAHTGQTDDWSLASVPDAWKRAGGGGPYSPRRGYAWHRCWVEIPDAWRGRDVEVVIEAVDDARQIYWNGVRVGELGRFPPEYRSGLGTTARFSIPAGNLRPGRANLLAVRLYNSDGRGGFNVAAPLVVSGDEAIRLNGNWQARPGDELQWARADEPVEAALFRDIEDATTALQALKQLQNDEGALPPAEAVTRFQVADDLRWELCLADPDIAQPLSLKFDERGRMWVMEYRQYPDPAGLTMVSRDAYLRTVYDRIPLPPPHHDRGQDRISIHEDTNGDGVYDGHSVFVDGLNIATSFALGRGGVWVLNPPYLLFYPDRDQDDRPDGPPEVHLEGFGLEDSHSVTNSLRWGPDGWLYATQGSTVTGQVRRPDLDEDTERIHSMGQLVWRYHPEQRRYEIFAEGGGNAFGLEIDAQGRIYSGHNGGDTRGFHYVQGGYYRKGFGKHGPLSNPYAFGYFESMAHHQVPRFTHTFLIYEEHALPSRYQGMLFGVGPLQSHLVMASREPRGSTFQTRDEGHPLTSGDPWFRPVDVQAGPDGSVYVADFYEQRIDHASHYQGRIHRESGRIYRLRRGEASETTFTPLHGMTTPELIAQLDSASRWTRQTARRLLGDRRDASAIAPLQEIIQEQHGQTALEALWALNLCGGFNEPFAVRMLDHPNPHVRLWSIRLACDDREASPELFARLQELAATESDVEVRSQLACSARRLPTPQALRLAGELVRRPEDADDPHLPLLYWWIIEDHVESGRELLLELLSEPSLWEARVVREYITERIMRRYAATQKREDLLTCARLFALSPGPDHDAVLIRGFEQAFEGRAPAGLPQSLVEAIAATGQASLALRLRQGEPAALEQALADIADPTVEPPDRLRLIQVLAEIQAAESVERLLELARKDDNIALREAALVALQAFPDPGIAERVMADYAGYPSDVRGAARALLVSRPDWCRDLLDAIGSEQFPQDDFTLPEVRRMLLHREPGIASAVAVVWGEVQGATTEQMHSEMDRLHDVILRGSGNPYQGRDLFMEHCGKCHRLFEYGGAIGPDLTSFQRSDLRRMLANIVNPSLEIREGYENFAIFLYDGRTLSGFIEDQDPAVVALKTVDGQLVVLERETIEEIVPVPRSLMPERLLTELDDQQVRDLFAYLRATQPLP